MLVGGDGCASAVGPADTFGAGFDEGDDAAGAEVVVGEHNDIVDGRSGSEALADVADDVSAVERGPMCGEPVWCVEPQVQGVRADAVSRRRLPVGPVAESVECRRVQPEPCGPTCGSPIQCASCAAPCRPRVV